MLREFLVLIASLLWTVPIVIVVSLYWHPQQQYAYLAFIGLGALGHLVTGALLRRD